METLKVYQYRALGQRWKHAYKTKNDTPLFAQLDEEMKEAWKLMSDEERIVIAMDLHQTIRIAGNGQVSRICDMSPFEAYIQPSPSVLEKALGAEVAHNELVLIDVDVVAHPGWPPRVWERRSVVSETEAPGSSLREMLDWTDTDGAAYQLARDLGILSSGNSFADSKWIFWINNPLCSALTAILDRLVEATILEQREEPDIQFRWNENFKLGK